MPEVFYYLDPEKITQRLFGSIAYRPFYRKGDELTCTVTGKKWSLKEVNTAWYETRNIGPKDD